MSHPAPTGRHYGLDWLRIAAFALLVLYHVAMPFSPWHWVIKLPPLQPWLIAPLALLTPWRLPLLFVVSGFATRRLLGRSADITAFLRERLRRLGLPLLFGVAVLLPPELWVRERLRGYDESLGFFWLHDYWSTTPLHGLAFPQWEHLWFVVYLLAYTLLLAAVVARVGTARLQDAADALARRSRLVWMPPAALIVMKLAVLFVVPEEQGLLRDWGGHAEYLPLFVFGFALGGSRELWPAIAASRRPALLGAVVAGAIVVACELYWPGKAVPPHAAMALLRAARLVMAWAMVLLLVDAADRWLDRDHRWRRPLAAAVFPVYLVHHPVLVLLAWLLLPLALPPLPAFALLLGGTLAVALAAAWLGARVDWLGPLLGLPRRRGPVLVAATG